MMRRVSIAVVFSCWATLLALAACPGPTPAPVTPPAPQPVPDPPEPPAPEPGPGPAATPCDRGCARAVQLRCTTDLASCVDACDRYEELGGAFAWNPSCMEHAPSCQALEDCRPQ